MSVIVSLSLTTASPASACGGVGNWTAVCDNTGSSIEIGASYDAPGTSESSYSDDSSDSVDSSHSDVSSGSEDHPSTPDPGSSIGLDGVSAIGEDCIDRALCRPVYAVEMLPTVTLSDVASFAPTPATVDGEPGGFGIVGMPVNFTAEATTHTVAGELFSRPVTVRFTPVSYVFDHGDTTRRVSATGGATWAALGLPQFSTTATSHTYPLRGVYPARVIVQYTAETDFGTGWRTIPGLLEIPGPTTEITILEAKTALVHHTCTQQPTAPGC